MFFELIINFTRSPTAAIFIILRRCQIKGQVMRTRTESSWYERRIGKRKFIGFSILRPPIKYRLDFRSPMDCRAYNELKFCHCATKSTTYPISWVIYVEEDWEIRLKRRKSPSKAVNLILLRLNIDRLVVYLLSIVTRFQLLRLHNALRKLS